MKSVKLNTLQAPANPAGAVTADRLYSVSLGNSVVVRFSSRRVAAAFQAEASRWLKDQLMTANLMLIEAFTAYRMAWMVLPEGAKVPHFDAMLASAGALLERCGKDSHVPDAVYRRWKALRDAIGELRAVALGLRDFHGTRSDAVAWHQLDLLARRCGAMVDELRNYGTDVDSSKGFRPSPYRTQ